MLDCSFTFKNETLIMLFVTPCIWVGLTLDLCVDPLIWLEDSKLIEPVKLLPSIGSLSKREIFRPLASRILTWLSTSRQILIYSTAFHMEL